MDFNQRLEVLFQACEIVQKNGLLTLDEAVATKQAMVSVKEGQHITEALQLFGKLITLGQSKGVYSIQDAHYIYLALENIETVIPTQEPEESTEEQVSENENLDEGIVIEP